MNKLPIVLGILVIVLGAGYYFYTTSQSTVLEQQIVEEEEEQIIMEEEEKALLTVEEILPFVGEDKDLRVFFEDLMAEFGGESPERENFDAVYAITFEENSGRSITLNVLDANHPSRAFLHYDRVRRQTPNSEEMDPPIAELSAKTAADPAERLGNIVIVKKDDKVFQLHTFEPNEEPPIISLDDLVELARLVAEQM
jgi:hypothetical protein